MPRPAHGGLMVVPPGHFAPYHASYHPHFLFPRWQPGFHRVVPVSYPHWQPRYWGRGVFIYSPPPGRVVVGGQTRTVDGGGDSSRAVDRNGDFGVGLLAGTYSSSYQGGVGGYGDFGMGLALSYRPVESLGLHLDWTRHSETFDEESERQESPLAASVNLYAFPWTRVSPYLTTGLTFTSRNIHDTYFNGVTYVEEDQQDTLYGPHIGLGLELAIGSNAAIDVEGRYAGYLNVDHDDSSTAGALQGNVGLSMYF